MEIANLASSQSIVHILRQKKAGMPEILRNKDKKLILLKIRLTFLTFHISGVIFSLFITAK